MRIKLTEAFSHLTATEKKAICLMISQSVLHGKVNRKVYKLENISGNSWKVTITENQTNIFNKLAETKTVVKFEIF